MRVQSLGLEDHLEEPTPVFLLRKSHGQKSLAGDSIESKIDTTEHALIILALVLELICWITCMTLCP